MSSRGYQQYNMIIATDSKKSWGGTDYTHLALDSASTIPTGLGTTNSTGETRTNQPSVTGAQFTKTFIIPTVFDAVSIIDGTIEGTLKLNASKGPDGHVNNYLRITNADLGIRAIDTSGASRTIVVSDEIWAGAVYVPSEGSVSTQLIYWLDVADVIINANERIVFDFTITYETIDVGSTDTMTASIYCTESTNETTVTLPLVMS